jgi:hypothetical protein
LGPIKNFHEQITAQAFCDYQHGYLLMHGFLKFPDNKDVSVNITHIVRSDFSRQVLRLGEYFTQLSMMKALNFRKPCFLM